MLSSCLLSAYDLHAEMRKGLIYMAVLEVGAHIRGVRVLLTRFVVRVIVSPLTLDHVLLRRLLTGLTEGDRDVRSDRALAIRPRMLHLVAVSLGVQLSGFSF